MSQNSESVTNLSNLIVTLEAIVSENSLKDEETLKGNADSITLEDGEKIYFERSIQWRKSKSNLR